MKILLPSAATTTTGGLISRASRKINHLRATSRMIETILVFVLALPLLAHAINSLNTRPMADDYQFAVIAREHGVIGSMEYWYQNWSGVVISSGLQSLVSLGGPTATAWLPLLTLLLWLGLLIVGAYRLLRRLGFQRPGVIASIIGCGIVGATLAGIPNVYQSLYWTSGNATYTSGLVALTAQAVLLIILIEKEKWISGLGVALTFGFGFLVGGFTESLTVMQIPLYLLAMIGAVKALPKSYRRRSLLLLGSGLVGGLLALLMALTAPGTGVRQSSFESVNLVNVLLLTLQNSAAFFAISLSTYSAGAMLLVILLSAWVVRVAGPRLPQAISFRQVLLVMGISIVAAVILVAAYLAAAAYGMGRMPASRAWIIPQYILTLVGVSIGSAIGLNLRRSPTASPLPGFLMALFALLLVASPILGTIRTVSEYGNLRVFAAEWDARDDALKQAVAAGQDRGQVRPLIVDMTWYAGLAVVGTDTLQGEFASAVADYYHMRELKLDNRSS